MNIQATAALAILLPFFMAPAAFISNWTFRRALVCGLVLVLAAASIRLFIAGPFSWEPSPAAFNWHGLLSLADFILLGLILCIGLFFRHRLVLVLTLVQLLPLILLKTAGHSPASGPAISADHLSLLMVLIVCVIGGSILVYALDYMRTHAAEHHQGFMKIGLFFFFLILFLGAMNGLVLSNDLIWMYFFWELTTLCSFVLIAHDGTEEALSSAMKALWINLLGGAFFIWGIYLIHLQGLPLNLEFLAREGKGMVMLLPVALLCVAAMTKSAQLPFHSWLTSAMVAPSPVSALLHSSTMVNAGVFLVLKLMPVYQGTAMSDYLALLGGLTFLSTAVLALTRFNAKKILAYSTIGSLGLIMACAGIGTPEAYTAAVMLIFFHAMAKALLFMGVGLVQQSINSRSIEDMWGLVSIMPGISLILVLGMASMFLPPFGVLTTKWMAVHAAGNQPLLVTILALGSALTVVYWTRWAGLLINSSREIPAGSSLSFSWLVKAPLYILALAILTFSLLVVPAGRLTAYPQALLVFRPENMAGADQLLSQTWAFLIYPLLLLAAYLILRLKFPDRKGRQPQKALPYYSGLGQIAGESYGYADPMGRFTPFGFSNYYFSRYLNHDSISRSSSVAALVLMLILVVVAL